jgi:23S rRNA (uracil1939-C5)-methyltransferase
MPQETVYLGNSLLEYNLDGLNLKLTPEAFIQNHPEQSANIYRKICQLAGEFEKKRILDLYCGLGIASLLLAKLGHDVLGIEYNAKAIQFAQSNAAENDLKNAKFIQGDVERLINRSKDFKPQLVLINPPRTGINPNIIRRLIENAPQEIIYVSCMPSTLARDVKELCKDGLYTIHECVAYDMFPQTAHVETLVHLKLSR